MTKHTVTPAQRQHTQSLAAELLLGQLPGPLVQRGKRAVHVHVAIATELATAPVRKGGESPWGLEAGETFRWLGDLTALDMTNRPLSTLFHGKYIHTAAHMGMTRSGAPLTMSTLLPPGRLEEWTVAMNLCSDSKGTEATLQREADILRIKSFNRVQPQTTSRLPCMRCGGSMYLGVNFFRSSMLRPALRPAVIRDTAEGKKVWKV